MKKWLAVISLVALVACGSQVTSANFGKVEPGMSADEVTRILGKPKRIETAEYMGVLSEAYIYSAGKNEVKVVLMSGQVRTKTGSFGS